MGGCVGRAGAGEKWGSRLDVGSHFPKREGLLPFSKDVGFRESVVPLYLLEGLGVGNTEGAEEGAQGILAAP